MDNDVPEELVTSSSVVTPRRISRKRKLRDTAKEPIELEDTPPRKKATSTRKTPSKKKTIAVDLTREDDEVEVVRETVLTTEKNLNNKTPADPTYEKRLRR